MKVELYAGPLDGKIVEVEDECPVMAMIKNDHTTMLFTFKVGGRTVMYAPDFGHIMPYNEMRFYWLPIR